MHEYHRLSWRKKKMIELGDAFIAFPCGTGTLEEIAEVISKVSLKHLSAPCILYNLDGYYNNLKALLRRMTEKVLSKRAQRARRCQAPRRAVRGHIYTGDELSTGNESEYITKIMLYVE